MKIMIGGIPRDNVELCSTHLAVSALLYLAAGPVVPHFRFRFRFHDLMADF
jgi:hypothetical protein